MNMDWSAWRIVVDPMARPQDLFAADELQIYLRKITGGLVKIVEMAEFSDPHMLAPLSRCIYVGASRLLERRHPDASAVKLADEEILIRRQGDAIILIGGGKRGVVYAVYIFLERYLGCRFFTEDDEYVPAAPPDLPEKFEFRSAPSFATRDCLSLYLRSGHWAAKLRLNGHFANVNSLQGSKRGIYPFVHTFVHVIPPGRYFKTHPEYFSLIDGERNPKQLCLSNPKVQELVIAQVLRWIEDNPAYDIFSLSENDGGGFCECEKCWRMNGREIRENYGQPTQPGAFFRFVNLVAAAVAKPYPNKWIDTLSYSYINLLPPKYFEMASNVIVRVCMNVDGPRRVRLWLKAAHRVSIWHYFTYRHFLLPFPLIVHSIPTVLKTYHQLGIKDVMLQMPEDEHGGVESTKLQVYAASKLFWDVKANPYPHVEEFMRYYYGPAAAAMQKVFNLTQSVLKQNGARWDCWKWTMDTLPPLRQAMPVLEKKARPLFAQAARSVRGTPYALRLAEAALPFRYFDLLREDRPPKFAAREAYVMDPAPIRKPGQEIVRTLRALKVRYWHHDYTLDVLEKALQPMDLRRLTSRFLDILVLPEVGGRIVQVIYRPLRRELIPSKTNLYEFESIGYEEYAGHWHHDPGYREKYTAEAIGSSAQPGLRLTAILSNRCRIVRTLRLQEDQLEIETRLTNVAPQAQQAELRLHARWRCRADTDRFCYTPRGGAEKSDLLQAWHDRTLEQPGGTGWVFQLNSLGLTIAEEFEPAATSKGFFCVQAGGTVVADLWTQPKKLRPGETLAFRHAWRIGPIAE